MNRSHLDVVGFPEEPDINTMWDSPIGRAISQAILYGVEVHARAIVLKVCLNPSLVLAHSYLSTVIDPDTGRTFFEGDFSDFLNWAAVYALEDTYGLRVGVITTGHGKYQKMKQAANIGEPVINQNFAGTLTLA